MRRALLIAGALMVLVMIMPEEAYACPVCFDSRDENRMAFFTTALLLTFLPLGMVGGVGLWMRKRFREMDEGDGPGGEADFDA